MGMYLSKYEMPDFSLFNVSQEIQTKDLRLEKIKLLSKLEKCKKKEGPRDSQDRVLNGFSKKIKQIFVRSLLGKSNVRSILLNLKYFLSELIQSTRHSFAIHNSGERHGWYCWCKSQQEKARTSTFHGEPTSGGPGWWNIKKKNEHVQLLQNKEFYFRLRWGE